MITKEELTKYISNWNNYWPLLWECLEATGGDVIECGMGDGSTKQLHDYCKERKRLLYSYEYDFQWFKKFKDLRTEWHDIVYIYGEDKKWDFVNERHVATSVLFIDHSPGERRKVDIELFAWKADIIIAHDTEPSADFGYQMRDQLAKFKYIKEYEVEKGAWTTAVSNFIDVTKFKAMSEQYKKDFDEGYEYALKNYDPQTGRMHNPDTFSNAWAEGMISGRYKVLKDTFGDFTNINWIGGKPNITK